MTSLRVNGDVQVVALCDVDEGSRRYERGWHRGLAPAKESTERHYAAQRRAGTYKGCDTYTDFRELLARDDIDTVNVATPDHWHGPIVVAAARAGKDIYCQKPLSLTLGDGKAMVEAVRRYGRVFQCGSQRRASAGCRHACELVRSGRAGKLHTVRVGLPGGHSNPGYTMGEEPMPVPEGFHYDRWLGPAPYAPYTHRRCHWTFRWIYDYSGGQVTDWGAHYIDMAHWGMGADLTGPVEVVGEGTFPEHGVLWNTATAFHFECTYASGVKLIVSSSGHGVRWEGSNGWIDLGGRSDPAVLAAEPLGPNDVQLYRSSSIYTNFVECVKSRRPTAAPVEVAHRSISVAHLGNIAMWLRRKVRWDPEREQFVNDPEAARLMQREKRQPWRL
jgi:predicted dehydrogenase